jgi:hypothetical protein
MEDIVNGLEMCQSLEKECFQSFALDVMIFIKKAPVAIIILI